MDALWNVLGGDDAWAAHQAAWKLAAGGVPAVTFLGGRLRPRRFPSRRKSRRSRSFEGPELQCPRDCRPNAPGSGDSLEVGGSELLRRPDNRLRDQLAFSPDNRSGVRPPRPRLLPPPVLLPLPPRLRATRALAALEHSTAPRGRRGVARPTGGRRSGCAVHPRGQDDAGPSAKSLTGRTSTRLLLRGQKRCQEPFFCFFGAEKVSGTVLLFLWTSLGTKRAFQAQSTHHLLRPEGLAERTSAIDRSPQRRQLGLRLRRVDLFKPVAKRRSGQAANSDFALASPCCQRWRLPQGQSSARRTRLARRAFRST